MSPKVIGIDCEYSALVMEIPFDEKANVSVGEAVIYRDEEGKEEFGVVKYCSESASGENYLASSKILRKATANDMQRSESHVAHGQSALEYAKEISQRLGLQMNVFRASYSFDGSKIHFTFTADERVDFRDLVKDLAGNYKKQIHLRQIGPRDKSKLIGGYGRCGRRLCCTSFSNKLESINMEMVRDQGLESKGSSKLSGACGKLLCCLKYEVHAYRDLRKGMPALGSTVKLKKSSAPFKEGIVMSIDVLNQKLKLRFKEQDEWEVVNLADVNIS